MGVTLTATAALVAISVGPPAALADNRDGAWYGWQTMTVDAAAVGTIALGVKVGSTPLALSGVGGLVLGAPVLHAVHGNWGNAGLSLSSRVLLPLAGFLLGDLVSNDRMGARFAKVLAGGLLGASSALVLDYAVISFDDASPRPAARQWTLAVSTPF